MAYGAGGDQLQHQHQPRLDDLGRPPRYPQVSSRIDDNNGRQDPSPLSASYHGSAAGAAAAAGAGYSPVAAAAAAATDLQEMSAEPKGSESGWEGGGTGSSGQTGQTGTGSGSGEEVRGGRRHDTFYNP